ncbi:hypothetical protein F4778DRAFT_786922 [Xylariomycetidae sp. FL2044]|nr:hypothetical protein F4778DRAFT_786922 [Xylariomycetidae sp. FL2044]
MNNCRDKYSACPYALGLLLSSIKVARLFLIMHESTWEEDVPEGETTEDICREIWDNSNSNVRDGSEIRKLRNSRHFFCSVPNQNDPLGCWYRPFCEEVNKTITSTGSRVCELAPPDVGNEVDETWPFLAKVPHDLYKDQVDPMEADDDVKKSLEHDAEPKSQLNNELQLQSTIELMESALKLSDSGTWQTVFKFQDFDDYIKGLVEGDSASFKQFCELCYIVREMWKYIRMAGIAVIIAYACQDSSIPCTKLDPYKFRYKLEVVEGLFKTLNGSFWEMKYEMKGKECRAPIKCNDDALDKELQENSPDAIPKGALQFEEETAADASDPVVGSRIKHYRNSL